MKSPRLYIIAGCNGAGKTTASMTVLPEVLDCNEFVNADEIAKGLSPFRPQDMAIEAGKLMIKRVHTLLSQHETFAIETTLSTRSYKNIIDTAHDLGYVVILLFFWLPSPLMAERRVAARVASGGHDIPKEVIHRRYWRGIENLFEIFIPIVDTWSLYDNSIGQTPIVEGNCVIDESLLSQIKTSCLNRKK
ncbi:MAG: AAA family ATPase [Muribaculaceae bacterium]|nr:AAA family ATPase [Muribaculaceae bacterium]